jgi:RNA polymerase sigma factor (sigma-70 family)
MAKFPLQSTSKSFMSHQALHYSETDIIAGLRQGDSKVLEIVYKQHYPTILHFIIQNNGTDQDAKDLYQEAILVLYEKLKQENFLLTCQIKTFVYSVCRRLWLKRLREKGRYYGKIEDFESFIPFEEDELNIEDGEHKYGAMNQALELIGEPCRTLLKDFYIENLSMQDISEKMGYTNADNAKNQKYKCLMRLKKLFFEKYK